MATAEELLREAQYAFQCISFGESSGNARNRRRASSLSRKIIRKYPGTMEAGEALAILRRLGEESYASNIAVRHRHITQEQHHAPTSPEPIAAVQSRTFVTDSDVDDVTLNWMGLLTWLVSLPRFVLAIFIVGGLFLFGIFGPLLFLPLIALILFTGPLRNSMNKKQQQSMNTMIRQINSFVASRG